MTRGEHLLDRGSYINGRAVKMLSGHSPIHVSIFRPVWLAVLAAEGKRVCWSVHYSSDDSKSWAKEIVLLTFKLLFTISNNIKMSGN